MWVLQASVTREKIDPETQRLREEPRIRFPNNRNIHPSVFYLTRPLKLTKDRFPTSNSLSTRFDRIQFSSYSLLLTPRYFSSYVC